MPGQLRQLRGCQSQRSLRRITMEQGPNTSHQRRNASHLLNAANLIIHGHHRHQQHIVRQLPLQLSQVHQPVTIHRDYLALITIISVQHPPRRQHALVLNGTQQHPAALVSGGNRRQPCYDCQQRGWGQPQCDCQ